MNAYRHAYKLLFVALIVAAFTSVAHAGHRSNKSHYTDYAKVTRVVPIYRTVSVNEPREQCYEERVRHHRRTDYESATPMIAGGVLGGILGNQFGNGNGKTFMTIAGTVLGGSIGRDIGHDRKVKNHRKRGYHTETHCEVVNDYREEEVIDGYRVTYRYKGKHFTTTMPHDPGRRMKVKVSVRPYE